MRPGSGLSRNWYRKTARIVLRNRMFRPRWLPRGYRQGNLGGPIVAPCTNGLVIPVKTSAVRPHPKARRCGRLRGSDLGRAMAGACFSPAPRPAPQRGGFATSLPRSSLTWANVVTLLPRTRGGNPLLPTGVCRSRRPAARPLWARGVRMGRQARRRAHPIRLRSCQSAMALPSASAC
jgi:hypothetical protein